MVKSRNFNLKIWTFYHRSCTVQHHSFYFSTSQCRPPVLRFVALSKQLAYYPTKHTKTSAQVRINPFSFFKKILFLSKSKFDIQSIIFHMQTLYQFTLNCFTTCFVLQFLPVQCGNIINCIHYVVATTEMAILSFSNNALYGDIPERMSDIHNWGLNLH